MECTENICSWTDGNFDELGLYIATYGDALNPANQGDPDLPEDLESSGRPAFVGTHQARSTVRSLGIEVDDAHEIAGQKEV